MRGRTVPESKIVIEGDFNYDDKGLSSSSVRFVADYAEYEQQQSEEAPTANPKTRLEQISTAAYTIYDSFSSKGSYTQSELIEATGLRQGTVSKALRSHVRASSTSEG